MATKHSRSTNKAKPLPVVFRYWIKEDDASTETYAGDRRDWHKVIALFPTDPAECQDWYACTSYQHIGGHSAANAEQLMGGGWDRVTRPATVREYRPLLKELHKLGYRGLRIYQRLQPWFRVEREREWKRLQTPESLTVYASRLPNGDVQIYRDRFGTDKYCRFPAGYITKPKPRSKQVRLDGVDRPLVWIPLPAVTAAATPEATAQYIDQHPNKDQALDHLAADLAKAPDLAPEPARGQGPDGERWDGGMI